MKTLYSFLLTMTFLTSLAQSPLIEWQKCLGGSGSEYAQIIEQTSDGGYIVAGSVSSNDGDANGNNGGSDFWVVKLNPNGDLIWQNCLGGTGYEIALDIRQTTDGGYIIAGFTNSNDGDVTGNHGGGDFWIVKLDANGGVSWQKCFGGTGGDQARSIQMTSDGGYIIAGNASISDGDVTGNHGGPDFWVVKLDSNGELIWQKCLGGSGAEYASSIKQTGDGGYIVAGYTESTDGDVTGNHGADDYWVVKLDSTGNLIWQKCFGGSGTDYAYSIQLTSDGGYVLAGLTESNDGDVTGHHGERDYWIVKLDSDGELMWQNALGGIADENAQSIKQTSDGGYIIAGNAFSNNGDVAGHQGAGDFWIVKLDPNGDLRGQECFGGLSSEGALSVQQTSDGGLVIAGNTSSNDGDVTGNHGGPDFWVVKLSQLVGVSELSAETFSVYPNPVFENFILSTESDVIGQSFVLVDQLGKVMLEGVINSQTIDFDMSSFPKGVYYLSVQNTQSSVKIVKQ